jgi:hypothetical protein
MKILILESSPISENPVNMHVKNSVELLIFFKSKGLSVDLISIASGGDKHTDKLLPGVLSSVYDVILVSYSSPYTHIDLCKKIIDKNQKAKYGWITTDYEISPHGVFNFDFYISNFEEGYLKKKYKKYFFTNLNSLIFKKRNNIVSKKYGPIYYSRYRKDRSAYVKKYDNKSIFLSTSKKNKIKYLNDNCVNYKYIDKLNFEKGREQLNLFESSLYIEDKTTHLLFNNLANRFYESTYCNCPVFFDISCLNTIKKSNYIIDEDFIIDGPLDFVNKSKNFDDNKKTKYLIKCEDQAMEEKTKVLKEIYDFIQDL